MEKRVERDLVTEAELDSLESQWWNSNAEIISKVWEMHADVSWAIRKRYLSKAKRFLAHKGTVTTVLELGCGSGWVGQSIADDQLLIVGTDRSEAQLELARERARKKGLEGICQYSSDDSLDWSQMKGKVDAVLIHSFLHHLDQREIDELFDWFGVTFAPGTKFWIYEPAFYARSQNSGVDSADSTSPVFSRFVARLIAALSKEYQKYGLIDKATSEGFRSLMCQANERGWYLSPKEVPFDIDAFTDYLKKCFRVTDLYWATIESVGFMFETNLVKNRALRTIVTRSIAPLVSYSDRLLASNPALLRQRLASPNYALHVWECTLK
jgi:SAM-dependent methyltransferase